MYLITRRIERAPMPRIELGNLTINLHRRSLIVNLKVINIIIKYYLFSKCSITGIKPAISKSHAILQRVNFLSLIIKRIELPIVRIELTQLTPRF